jgi:hypothetical protein
MSAFPNLGSFLAQAVDDHRNGWSIGTFGAIGEFVRDPDEPVERRDAADSLQITSARGAMRIQPCNELRALAYDTLSADGETWGIAVALCLPALETGSPGVVHRIGVDGDALRAADHEAILFDLGIGRGHVRMCVRTADPTLIKTLERLEGQALLSEAGKPAGELIRNSSPVRVMLSPVGRIEVYAPIPPPNGKSPNGPHTHLLPKLIAAGRTHSANAPIPQGLQPVLMLHPQSPWRDSLGNRTSFDAALNLDFERCLSAYGLPEDQRVRAAVEAALQAQASPEEFASPATRRGRIQVRITLRRLAQRRQQDEAVRRWRARFDAAAHGDADDQVDIPPP